MTFDDIRAGSAVFLDSNTLIFHFTTHPKYGAACTRLLDRVEHREIEGVCSAHVLAEVVHRLMTIEAMNQLGWPPTRLAARLKKHHAEIANLRVYQVALTRVAQLGIQVLPLTENALVSAARLCHHFELLTNDAIIVAIMQQHAHQQIASLDADFDRVPGLTRYSPV